MPLLKEETISRPVNIYINHFRDEKTIKDNIRISSNHISILDDEGESNLFNNIVIEEIVPLGKILPTNL